MHLVFKMRLHILKNVLNFHAKNGMWIGLTSSGLRMLAILFWIITKVFKISRHGSLSSEKMAYQMKTSPARSMESGIPHALLHTMATRKDLQTCKNETWNRVMTLLMVRLTSISLTSKASRPRISLQAPPLQ